ncbi:MAG: hypothetical protein M0Z80_10310 [Treponema sp.]|nr:hypothetical protein [Treponema sp.]
MNRRASPFLTLAAAAATVLCLVSCNAALLSDLARSVDDPTVVAPGVSSFVYENRIDVSWTADANADQYVVERAQDAAVPVWSAIYQGTGTSYTDTNVSDQGRYLYRLSKVRGTRTFGPSEAVLGIGSATCRDAFEPNDEEAEATAIGSASGSTLLASLWYYSSVYQQDGAVLTVQDIDWYAVSVPPNRTANIVVTQVSPALAGGSTNTWMYFYQKGMNPQQIVNSQTIPVTNYSNATATFLFKIYPVPTSFSANGGGALVNYTVSLDSITN